MPKPRFGKPSFKGMAKAAGSSIGAISIKIFECNGCGAQYKGDKPSQCMACGRLDFSKIDSREEAHRLGELRLLQSAGIITNLKRQTKHALYAFGPSGERVKVGEYWSDFDYDRTDTGAHIIEDVKGGAMTDLSQWKIRHMAAQGETVTLVTPKGRF